MDIKDISVDVIIPAYWPDDKFIRLMLMLERQTHTISNLIIVNTEEEGLSEKCKSRIDLLNTDEGSSLYGKIILKHIDKTEFDHAYTRDMGVQLSNAQAFMCMTDDAVPADEYLIERLCRALYQEDDIAMAYARQLADEDTGYAEKYTREFNYPGRSVIKGIRDVERLGIKTYFASNVCCMYRRSAYDQIGGFEGPAIFNEDMVFAARAVKSGYRIAYCAEAEVVHSHTYTAMQQLRRNFDLGISQSMHRDIFDEVPSEGEGMRLVMSTARYLMSIGRPLLIPKLVIHSGFKLIGYKLGRNYEKLPDWLLLKLAMNKSFVKTRIIGGKESR